MYATALCVFLLPLITNIIEHRVPFYLIHIKYEHLQHHLLQRSNSKEVMLWKEKITIGSI